MVPSLSVAVLPWTSGLDFKVQTLKYSHMNSFISITRDRDTGQVYPDPGDGGPRVKYSPSTFDRAHTLEGVIAIAKIAYVQGAEELHVCITGVEPFIRNPTTPSPSSTDDRFKAWLRALKAHGNTGSNASYASAHQMGSNRMSTSPSMGVVDPHGMVWGTEGLYVADASVFPSASGVNPMVTNMAISDWISRGVGRVLGSEAVGAKL